MGIAVKGPPRCHRTWAIVALLLVVRPVTASRGPCVYGSEGAASPSRRWETTIEKLEARDRRHPPPREGILFAGSSSIRLWDLQRWFPGMPVVNEGFGGSKIADSTFYADRIIIPHRPRTVVLYAGDNDIAGGKTPQEVADDFRRFVARVHAALPRTRIVFLAIKPSLARWKHVAAMRAANRRIRAFTRTDDRLAYVDTDTAMLDETGRPRRELFRADGLHLNEKGYRLWTSLLRPYLVSKEGREERPK